jgi:hypothetical protein
MSGIERLLETLDNALSRLVYARVFCERMVGEDIEIGVPGGQCF